MVYYEIGTEEPEILGSGSTYKNVKKSKNLDILLSAFDTKIHNYLIKVEFKNGNQNIQEYDFENKIFIKY